MQYARFDHTQPAPRPVIGWYDTGLVDYGDTLPDAADLLEVTAEQWAARVEQLWAVDANGALVAGTPPPLSPADQATVEEMTRIGQGIAATSTGTPAASATYPLDDASVALLGSVARDIAAGLGMPDSGVPPTGVTRATPVPPGTFAYADLDGVKHDLDAPQVTALYTGQRDLRATLAAQADVMAEGGTPAWPDQSVTIP